MKRVLAIVCLVAALGVLQGFGKSYSDFFSADKNRAYKILLLGAHPSNDFISGSCVEHKNYVTVTIWSKDSDGTYKTVIDLYLKRGIFSRLEVYSCTDSWPCFLTSTLFKSVVEEMLSDYQSDTIRYLEKLYGKRVRDMDVEELCTLILSLKFLAY